jgi:thymidine kinase
MQELLAFRFERAHLDGMPSKLTPTRIAELRDKEGMWLSADDSNRAARRMEFQAALLANAPALLDAAETLAQLRTICAEETDLGEFNRRVTAVVMPKDRR